MQDIQIRQQTSSRLRAKVASIRGRSEKAEILVQLLLRDPQISSADARPATGSVILHFNETAAKDFSAIGILKTALTDLDEIGWRQSQLPYRPDIRDARVAATGRGLVRIAILTFFTLFHLIGTFILKSPLSQRWIVAGTLLGGMQLFRRALKDANQGKLLSANIFLSGATLIATLTGESAAALEVLWIQEVGQLLEDYIQDRSRRAIREIILVRPQNAFIKRHSQLEILHSWKRKTSIAGFLKLRPDSWKFEAAQPSMLRVTANFWA